LVLGQIVAELCHFQQRHIVGNVFGRLRFELLVGLLRLGLLVELLRRLLVGLFVALLGLRLGLRLELRLGLLGLRLLVGLLVELLVELRFGLVWRLQPGLLPELGVVVRQFELVFELQVVVAVGDDLPQFVVLGVVVVLPTLALVGPALLVFVVLVVGCLPEFDVHGPSDHVPVVDVALLPCVYVLVRVLFEDGSFLLGNADALVPCVVVDFQFPVVACGLVQLPFGDVPLAGVPFGVVDHLLKNCQYW